MKNSEEPPFTTLTWEARRGRNRPGDRTAALDLKEDITGEELRRPAKANMGRLLVFQKRVPFVRSRYDRL